MNCNYINNLTPGNKGKDCLYNGMHYDKQGNLIPICCDECDFLLCCVSEENDCCNCAVFTCPNKKRI